MKLIKLDVKFILFITLSIQAYSFANNEASDIKNKRLGSSMLLSESKNKQDNHFYLRKLGYGAKTSKYGSKSSSSSSGGYGGSSYGGSSSYGGGSYGSSSSYGGSSSSSYGGGGYGSARRRRKKVQISLFLAISLIISISLTGMIYTAYIFMHHSEGTVANCCRVTVNFCECLTKLISSLYRCELSEIPQLMFTFEGEDEVESDTKQMKLRPGIERALEVEHKKAMDKVELELQGIKLDANGAKKKKKFDAKTMKKMKIATRKK